MDCNGSLGISNCGLRKKRRKLIPDPDAGNTNC